MFYANTAAHTHPYTHTTSITTSRLMCNGCVFLVIKGGTFITAKRRMLSEALKDWYKVIENPDAKVYTVKRTEPQNNSLHKGLRALAERLSDSGLDMRKVLKPEVEIPWTVDSAKEYLFNPIAKVMFDKTSSELSTTEIQQVWDVLNRHTGEKFGITVEWPDRFNGGKA